MFWIFVDITDSKAFNFKRRVALTYIHGINRFVILTLFHRVLLPAWLSQVCLQYNNSPMMLDNFFEQNYHSYDAVYTSASSGHCVFLGDVQSAIDCDFHSRSQIRTVVTAASNMEHIIVGEDIRHITYPLLDGKHENIAAFFERFFFLMEDSLQKGNVLVHCAAGISRSATLMISYLMRKERLSFKDAIAYLRRSRPSVLPNLGFERQLKQYEEKLRGPVKTEGYCRRSQVRTSESVKSEGSVQSQLLPLVGPLLREGKGLKFVEKLSEKDIQILRVYNNGRNNIRNRLNQRPKNTLTTLPDKRGLRLQIQQDRQDQLFRIFKRQNLREAKSCLPQEATVHQHKKTDSFKLKPPTDRGHTTDELKSH